MNPLQDYDRHMVDVLRSARDRLLLNSVYLRSHRLQIATATRSGYIKVVEHQATSAGKYERFELLKAGANELHRLTGEHVSVTDAPQDESVEAFLNELLAPPPKAYLCTEDEAW